MQSSHTHATECFLLMQKIPKSSNILPISDRVHQNCLCTSSKSSTIRLAPLFLALCVIFCPAVLPFASIGCRPRPFGVAIWRARQRLGRRGWQACLVPGCPWIIWPGWSPGVSTAHQAQVQSKHSETELRSKDRGRWKGRRLRC